MEFIIFYRVNGADNKTSRESCRGRAQQIVSTF